MELENSLPLPITWAEPGLWNGRKAHFFRLRVEHQPTQAYYLHSVEVDLPLWKPGDALKTLGDAYSLPLAADREAMATGLAPGAPEIALLGPRTASFARWIQTSSVLGWPLPARRSMNLSR